MKKTGWTIIGIIGILIIIILALPKYFSSQNQVFVQQFIDGVQQTSNGHINGKIINASEGWFSSNSTVTFNYQYASNAYLINQSPISGQIILQLTNHYGPVLFTPNGLKLGQMYIEFLAQNNEQTAKYFKDPLLQGTTLINFAGNANLRFTGLNALPLPDFQFDGIKSVLSINKNLTEINGYINYGNVQLVTEDSPKFTLLIPPFTQQFHLTRSSDSNLWTGTKSLEFPMIAIKSDDFNSQYNNVSIKTDVNINQDLMNGKVALTIPFFNIDNDTGNYKANLELKNLNTQALKQILSLAKNLDTAQITDQQMQLYAQQLSNYAINLFSGKFTVLFDSILNLGKFDKIIVKTSCDNTVPSLSKINFSAKYTSKNNKLASINLQLLNLNKSTLGQMLRAIIATNGKINSEANQIDALQKLQISLTQLYPQLFTASSKIYLNVFLPENEKSGFQLLNARSYFTQLPENPTANDLWVNGHLTVNWKIPTFATDLIKMFGPIFINKIQNPQNQTLANNFYNMLQQMIPQLIQQGYLIQQGNYYISNWSISNNIILMNNKSIQPLLDQLKNTTSTGTPTASTTTPTVTTPTPNATVTKTPSSVPIKAAPTSSIIEPIND